VARRGSRLAARTRPAPFECSPVPCHHPKRPLPIQPPPPCVAAHAYFRRGFSHKALRDYEKAAFDFETARSLDPDNPSLALNYRGAHSIDTVILCAAGEEPSFGPSLDAARDSRRPVLVASADAGVAGIPHVTGARPAPGGPAVRTATRAPASGRAPVTRAPNGVPLQAADLEHGRAGLRGTA